MVPAAGREAERERGDGFFLEKSSASDGEKLPGASKFISRSART